LERVTEVYPCEVLIIGAGVIGLAIAERLSHKYENVLLVDKESSFGQHTSSRNSEVIHSGIYYPPDSLKAKMCVDGNALLYKFSEEHNIPYKRCGKLIVASSAEEERTLEKLQLNAQNNGVTDIRMIDSAEIKELEPTLKAQKALLVNSTGIIDSHSLMQKLENLALKNGVVFSYRAEINDIKYKNKLYKLTTVDNDVIIEAPVVINASGLWSDTVAHMLDLKEHKLYWCKGEYYTTTKYKNMKRLIYPVPDPEGKYLGIHTVIDLDGNLSFGPNAYYVNDLNYGVGETNKQQFYDAINRYLSIDYEDLAPGLSGIRPKLQGPQIHFADFMIKNEQENGYNNFINLMGIESPGLTGCLAIADYVEEIIN
jgi:L-2-hydroxyglutarate oxidase LhgO